jgi:diketogulonate reductase-like aldo/keto reductase
VNSTVLILLSTHGAGYLDGLADAYEQGLVKAVGVSNYNGLYHVFILQKKKRYCALIEITASTMIFLYIKRSAFGMHMLA